MSRHGQVYKITYFVAWSLNMDLEIGIKYYVIEHIGF